MYPVHLRDAFGNVYVSCLDDSNEIPWRPLTIGEYIEYDKLYTSAIYPVSYLENEIFKKCVLKPFYVENINTLRAGIVSAVSNSIMDFSGPRSLNELNLLLEFHRGMSNTILDQIVSIVCQGFPAYTPEMVYAMDYHTLMARLAQAENKLIRTHQISEPINFFNKEEATKDTSSTSRVKKDTSHLLEQYYAQEGFKDPRTHKPVSANTKAEPKNAREQVVIADKDVKDSSRVFHEISSGHDKADQIIAEYDMVQDTAKYYQDYIDQLKKDGKIIIKSDKERMEAALERARKNEAIVQKVEQVKGKKTTEIMQEIKAAKELKLKKLQERKNRSPRRK